MAPKEAAGGIFLEEKKSTKRSCTALPEVEQREAAVPSPDIEGTEKHQEAEDSRSESGLSHCRSFGFLIRPSGSVWVQMR